MSIDHILFIFVISTMPIPVDTDENFHHSYPQDSRFDLNTHYVFLFYRVVTVIVIMLSMSRFVRISFIKTNFLTSFFITIIKLPFFLSFWMAKAQY